MEAINKNGLMVEEQGEFINYNNVKAYTNANETGPCDLVLFLLNQPIQVPQ